MKQRTRNKWKQIISLVLAATFLLCLSGVEVHATSSATSGTEENDDVERLQGTVYVLTDEELVDKPSPATMLVNCNASFSSQPDGLYIDISTGSVGTASVLGIKDIEIQKKTGSNSWKTVATVDDVEGYQCSTVGVSIIYYGAEYGETYRVKCVHYGTVDSYTESEHTTIGVTYKY